MQKYNFFNLLLSAFILSACSARQANDSNEQFYFSHQIHRTKECEAILLSQYDELVDSECIYALEKSYEEYKKEREEYLKEE
ncbi:MAG: hypothetical protein V3V18_04760 [Methylococcales bacterium]